MIKVGLITILDYENYGNRLQNYACQEVLRSMNCDVTTIVNSPVRVVSVRERFARLRRKSVLQVIQSRWKVVRRKLAACMASRADRDRTVNLHAQRISALKAFTSQFISETPFCITPDRIPADLPDSYDAFVVGSDQVWNPQYRGGSPLDFLVFAPPEKRIAYAVSFGVSSLPKDYRADYQKWLTEMTHISVRENAGAAIVKELTGAEVPVLIDPTLMLSKQQWLSVAAFAPDRSNEMNIPDRPNKPDRSGKPDEPYLLVYMLGRIGRKVQQQIASIAQLGGLPIVYLNDPADQQRYVINPCEFLDYFHHAAMILTDSYHGTAFSIIFERPFLVFAREGHGSDIHSRLNTLLAKFSFSDRTFNAYAKQTRDQTKAGRRESVNQEAVRQETAQQETVRQEKAQQETVRQKAARQNVFQLDYSRTQSILQEERRLAFEYLKGALGQRLALHLD